VRRSGRKVGAKGQRSVRGSVGEEGKKRRKEVKRQERERIEGRGLKHITTTCYLVGVASVLPWNRVH
jgi:hypothetical protein